jgi:dTDP-4-dehydrorhamnose reductase
VAAAVVALADRRDVSGPLHVAGPEVVSRADLARAFAAWMGRDPGLVATSSLVESGLDRPGTVALDSSRAAALGIRCRSLGEALQLR